MRLVDKELGLVYCGGDEDIYNEVIITFAEELEELIVKIDELYRNEDWKEYVVRVHGLKNSAITIGASSLSEESKKMEFAGKEDRIADIKAEYDEYVVLMNDTLAEVKEYISLLN